MRAWLRENGWSGARDALSILSGLPLELARDARDYVLRRPYTYR